MIEEPAQRQRSDEVTDRERQQVQAYSIAGHRIEAAQHECVRKEDGVVQERLRRHQHQAEHRAARIVLEETHGEIDQAADALARVQPKHHQRRVRSCPRGRRTFDAGNDDLGLTHTPVKNQPAWTFRQRTPKEEHDEREQRADEKCEAPPDVGLETSRHQEDRRAQRAQHRSHPETAVDREVSAAPIAGRNELLDRGIDCRILAADAGPGEKAEQRKGPEVGCKGRSRRCNRVDTQRHEKKPLAAEPVGEPAEEQCTEHRPRKIGAGSGANLRVGQMEPGARLQRTRDGARERDLEPIENPCDPECDDDECVESRPAEAVEPRRQVSLYDVIVGIHLKMSGCLRRSRTRWH